MRRTCWAWLLTWSVACTGTTPENKDAGTTTPDASVTGRDAGRADASTSADASVVPDASVIPDASIPRDAASPMDAASTPDASSVDAAMSLDASTLPDAAPPVDAAQPMDASMPTDASTPPDAACTAPAADRTGTQTLTDGTLTARADRISGADCQRTWRMTSNAPLRDNQPANPRTFSELPDWPVLHSGNDLLDAVYALALEETREDSLPHVQDGAFDNGQPISCPAGGCFQTGRLWTYAWTRDTSYAVDLGLASLDPIRARNTLEFKLSARRDGTDEQVVQDTGTGGSWPVSTDRVVWALGAWETLQHLDGTQRSAFASRAFTALRNTIEQDRVVVFDAAMGLYRGESSFLDWREQTYPPWTASDVVHIGMSFSLSTNVLHLRALEVAAALAREQGLSQDESRYQGYADALRTRIKDAFTLADGTLSAFITTALDPAPVRRWDLLGNALAILHGVADPAQALTILSAYPHLPRGVPVIFPQQKETPIYHNRATWPFVTAYWARAGRAAGHPAVVDHALRSLLRGAALNLSHMENWEVVSGEALHSDGAWTGPVVNSQRQLWSVAAFVSIVQQVLVGMEHTGAGMRVKPFIPVATRNSMLRGTNALVLHRVPWRGRLITVRVQLPPADAQTDGALTAVSARLNGVAIAPDAFIPDSMLLAENTWEVTVARSVDARAIRAIEDVSDYRVLFGPRAPAVTSVVQEGGALRVGWDASGEASGEVSFSVYRDGVRIADALPGTTTSYLDTLATPGTTSHCYTVEATFTSTGTHSQHAAPFCFWGSSNGRIQSFPANQFTWNGGTPSTSHGRFHHDFWGAPEHSLELPSFAAAATGPHLLHVVFGNGGPISTGITCAHKRLRVLRSDDGTEVGRGYLMMPHLGSWDRWADSSYVRVELEAGRSYRVVIDEDVRAINMSALQHHARYTGGTGGSSAANFVNIAELKVLGSTGP